MSEATNPTSVTNGDAATAAAPAAAKLSAAAKLTTHPKVQQAITLAKTHPLGAVATVAAAAALVEVEFAVGILAGLGATALLASRSGPEARERVIAQGKHALAQARVAIAKRKQAMMPGTPPPAAAEAVTPPPN
jgi:hypothetical protein